jgi:hypothetical protein
MNLNEGGNVFGNSVPFDHKNIPSILKTINSALDGIGVRAIPVGSSATPTPGRKSGDMDVIVDEKELLDFFKVKDAKTARKALNDYISKKGFETAQSGINVHVNVPVGDDHHQVDIMVAPNAEKISKFHTHDIPQGSPYKGVNKHLILAILAKSKGYMWSAWQGLFSRNAEGKKGDFVTDDLTKIAEILTGKASSNVLGSVESILSAFPKEQAAELLDRARQDPNWREVKQESIERIKQLAGINEQQAPPPMPNITGLAAGQSKDLGNGEKVLVDKTGNVFYSGGFGTYVYNSAGQAIQYQSPNVGGTQRSTNLTTNQQTTSYSAGPVSTTSQVDAQGNPISDKISYNTGQGTLGAEKDYKTGITTKTATPNNPNVNPNTLMPTSAIAAARGVDPKKFAQFQKQNPTATEELDAMLRIARLR